ncbi:uncharacterized protein LOC128218959 [Mya arenaria]|uniref:uncharacterized protein LOC128218959 n=1 Tax=Mya arenaria TaxID=6604 RepID=UPI0022E364A1|nr:uncharacterized protein LOC128218959 [Mya arenaria]
MAQLVFPLLIGSICICASLAYHPSYFSRFGLQRTPSYKYRPFDFKRGRSRFDRISMGFIKRDGEMPTDTYIDDNENTGYYSDEQAMQDFLVALKTIKNADKQGVYQKRYIDRVSSGFVRKKRSITDPETSTSHLSNDLNSDNNKNPKKDDTKTNENVESIKLENSKRYIDRMSSSFVKKGIDRLTSGFIKKDFNDDDIADASAIKQLDRLPMQLDKADVENSKTHPMAGLINDDDAEIEKRGLDRLDSGLVKRPIDRMYSGFVKRPIDRISGFVKRPYDDSTDEIDKRRLDRLYSSFIKKNADVSPDKRRIDRINSGFVKRPMDRLYSGFVKKDDEDSEGSIQAEKRYLDRMYSGFVRRNDGTNDLNGYENDIADIENDKRGFDRLYSGFVKKSENDIDESSVDTLDNIYDMKEDKRRLDRLYSGFVKKDSEDKYGPHDDVMLADKRRIDRLSSGFVKRPFDRLYSGFVKKDRTNHDADFFDESKRYIDRLNSGFVKRNIDPESSLNQRRRRSLGDFRSRVDRIGYGFIKRSDPFNTNAYNNDNYTFANKRRLSRLQSLFL